MRLFFKKGKQKRILEIYKKSNSFKSWTDVAINLNVNLNALKEWRYENASLPSQVYDIVDKDNAYKKWVIGELGDNWGRSLGGKNAPIKTHKITLPKRAAPLAELIGIIWGDGNIYINNKYGVHQIRIASHYLQEKEYSVFISKLIEKLFGIKPTIKQKGSCNYVCVDNKYLAHFLMREGIRKNSGVPFKIPVWIEQNTDFLKAFVRGLTDTDGSVYRLSKKDSATIRISFKNTNLELSLAYRKSLLALGYNPSKLIYGNVFLTKKSDTTKYLKEISFHNKKHLKRIKCIALSSSGQIL